MTGECLTGVNILFFILFTMAAVRSLNKALIIGNLTRDPELKQTEGGAHLCTFGVATNSVFKKDEQDTELAEFHNIVAWGKLAEICSDILKTGMLVYVEGEIRTRSWEDEGVKKYRTEIRASEMKLLDDKGLNNDKEEDKTKTDNRSEGKSSK